ncbi:S8 family serine peptidase [Nakamurella deserti]|uniref:S8 family serine peptidase n=1 Tax=Nakamurella deserti TaxID=2164074 RepID=UPI000DBEA555|nr:S8 family serine peptidase [Nakamurella deserti]
MRTPLNRLLLAAFVGLLTVPAAAAPATGAPVTVVITLSNPLLDVPLAARAGAIDAARAAVFADLRGPAPRDVAASRSASVIVATVTPAQRSWLAADPRVAAVTVDAPLPAAAPVPADAAADRTVLPPFTVPDAACTGTQDAPQLEPESLQTLNVRSDDPTAATAAALGYDGSGVTVGIVTTNLDPGAPNFIRPDGSRVVVDYRTYVADGTRQVGEAVEAFGDVSAVGSQGVVTYDLADVVDPAATTLPGGHCWVRVVGTAPGADIVATNAYDHDDLTTAGAVLSIDHAVAAGVDVLSESFGSTMVPEVGSWSAIQAANDAAIDAGVTVVVSSGDGAGASTVTNPATDPRVIAVGASTNGRLPVQIGAYGTPGSGNGTWRNGTTATLSSAGVTQTGRTIDVVAPGDAGWTSCVAGPRFQGCDALDGQTPSDIAKFGGTSLSAPLTAGVVALVVQAYRDGHGGADPTPAQVKQIVTSTAGDLGLPADQQGSGQVDAYAAVLAARSLPAPGLTTPTAGAAAPAAPGTTLVSADSQFTVDGAAPAVLRTEVTNTGTTPVTLTPSVTTDVVDTAAGSVRPVTFDPAAPVFTAGEGGGKFGAAPVAFDVPAGAAWVRLRINATPTTVDPMAAVQASVLTPDGTLAAFGDGENGLLALLARPEAGTWTAVMQAGAPVPWVGDLIVDTAVRHTVATAEPLTIAPGATVPVAVTVPAATEVGDTVATLRVGSGLALPVVQRRALDLSGGSASVSGTVAPVGADREPFQTGTWEFDVEPGHRSLSAALRVSDMAIEATGVLIDPDGVVRSTIAGISSPAGGGLDLAQTVADPTPGRWRYTLLFFQAYYPTPVAAAPFTVDLSLDGVRPAADGLPVAVTSVAGTTVPAVLTVTNPGTTPLSLRVDARTDETAEVELAPQGADAAVPLPVIGGQTLPSFAVPFFTTGLRLTSDADVATVPGLQAPLGYPDLVGAPATSSAVTASGPVTAGFWTTSQSVPGPVGDVRSPDGTATVRAVATTLRYDPSITDADGAPFVTETGLSPAADPVVVAPGATATVQVRIPVPDRVGDTVAGRLALVTAATPATDPDRNASGASSGDVVAVFPYSYSVVAPEPAPTTDPAPTSEVVVPTTPSPSGPTTPATASTTATTPTTAATATTAAAPSRTADGPLAHTGADPRTPGVWGLGLLALGAVLLVAARQRRRRSS